MRWTVLVVLAGAAAGDVPTVSGVVETIGFHPTGEPARVGMRFLSRAGEPGWKALSRLVLRFAEPLPDVALLAARALGEGPEPERLEIAASTYLRVRDPAVRAALAFALAFAHAEHASLLEKHLFENREGARAVLEIVAPRALPERELRRCLEIPDLAPVAYDALKGRGLSVQPRELLSWARAVARAALDPAICERHARAPDFLFLRAVARVLADPEADVRDGAYCLLLTTSGKRLLPDADIWRSWIAARAAEHELPDVFSEGRVHAAVVRGVRTLRADLLADGRCLWVKDPRGTWAVGSTALAVMALRAAGVPKDDPAIEKALGTTLLVLADNGPPGLRPFDRKYETYCFSLLALALCATDANRFRAPLAILRRRLLQGMLAHGQWSYQCLEPTDTRKPGIPDNSITQYAVLALRALRRAGHDVPTETWKTVATFLHRSVNPWGGWSYRTTGKYSTGRQVSMTAAGVSSLAICLEGLYGRDAPGRIRSDPALERALVYLGGLVAGADYGNEDLYAYYGVERACVLADVATFRGEKKVYGWYRAGVRRLLGKQDPGGAWRGLGYGDAIDTSYAILFLTRATATVGRTKPVAIRVSLPDGTDVPAPPPARLHPIPPPPPRPPVIEIDADPLATRTGPAVLRGRVVPRDATLRLDTEPVPLDARGRFAVPLTVARKATRRLVARAPDGLETVRSFTVAFDLQAPGVALLGPRERHVGTQVLVFRADEPLQALRVAGRVVPADGPVVRAAVELREGARTLTVVATDRAGNEGRREFELVARNRHLVLDGRSALRVDLRAPPAAFTLECWARGDEPKESGTLCANTESSGFGLFWWQKAHPVPHGLVRVGRDYVTTRAKPSFEWGKWTHLAVVHDGAQVRSYVNGRLHAEAPASGPRVRSSRPLWIGAEPDRRGAPNAFFKGEIDEVRLSSVARYDGAFFRPARAFMRDRHTLLLLHFDRETFLDDSGLHHHAAPHGAPTLGPRPPDTSVLDHARAELRRELPPEAGIPLSPEQKAAQDTRARRETQALELVPVTVRLRTRHGLPLAGVAAAALHTAYDVSHPPVVTDGRGEAVLRLPRGPWRLDLATHEPAPGRIVFARVDVAVRGPGREEIVLDARREVRFRGRGGEARAAHAVTLAWPDLSFHRRVEAAQGQLEIVTADRDRPILVQALRRPDDAGAGYVLRQPVGPGLTVVETDPEDTTPYVFAGNEARKLVVRLDAPDALPLGLAFTATGRRTVRLRGLDRVVVHLDVEWRGSRYGFTPRPFALDGAAKTFLGKPPFQATVGHVLNGRPRYEHMQNTVSFRVFLSAPSGLVLRHVPRGPFVVGWEQVLDGAVRASGKTHPPARVLTAPIDPKRIGDLRYRLHVRGPGENRRVEVAGRGQVAEVTGGKVRTWAFPEMASNARLWCEAVHRAVRAYEETCPVSKVRVDIERSLVMPPRLGGMGGYGGNVGWMWLPEGSIYGFVDTFYWTGLLAHELGHVHHYGHGNPQQARIMRQAGRRAGRRLWAIRPGMARVPEGDRFRPLLDAVTRGDVRLDASFDDERDVPALDTGDGPGDGVLVPNLELTGDDAVFTWYWRAHYSGEPEQRRRRFAAAWSWWLTCRGYTDPEIQIAIYSRAAGTSLAWLARLRGQEIWDHRIDAAMDELERDRERLVLHKERGATLHRWATRRYGPTDDLDAAEEQLLRELGTRRARVDALLALARERLARRDPARGERGILRALAEARLGGDGLLAEALDRAAPLWAAR